MLRFPLDLTTTMLSGFYHSDIPIFLFCSVLIVSLFAIIKKYVDGEKSASWIVMLISSGVLSIVGLYYTALAELDGWSYSFIFGEDSIPRVFMLFFLSANVMDILIGLVYYPKYLDPFTTIAHHIFYSLFILCLLNYRYSRGFLLCFPMEVPTVILAIGTVWKSLRSDIVFGATFLVARILYNIYLVTQLYIVSNGEGVIWKICLFVLSIHLYWFQKWFAVYGAKLLVHDKGDPLTLSSKVPSAGIE